MTYLAIGLLMLGVAALLAASRWAEWINTRLLGRPETMKVIAFKDRKH